MLSKKEKHLVKEYANKLINKRILTEESPPSYAQKFRDWCKSKGLDVDMGKGYLDVSEDGKTILTKKTNSFFRSAHLDSFANQISKKLGIDNDFNTTKIPPMKIGDVLNKYKPKFIEYIAEMRNTLVKTGTFNEKDLKDYLIQLINDTF